MPPIGSRILASDLMTLPEGASLPTALDVAIRDGQIQRGHRVLLLGTGGVSVWALQLAVAAGAEVFITSSSDAKLDRARALGAAHTVNYHRFPKWDEEVLRLSGGRGVDHVLEVGGPGTLGRSIQALAAGGHFGE